MSLENNFALITGANSELGVATVLEFAKDGIEGLLLQYHKNRDRIDDIKSKLKEHCKVVIAKADVSSYDEVLELRRLALDEFKRLDIIIAYAGYPAEKGLWNADPLELSDEMLDKPWNVDFKGSYNCIKAFAKDMKNQGYGRIVLTASTPALYGDHVGLAFTITKAAIVSLTRSLAPTLAPEITINALALGSIATTANLKNYTDEELKDLTSKIPLKRFGEPEEVVKVAKFLASRDSSYITGQTIVVDGGEFRY